MVHTQTLLPLSLEKSLAAALTGKVKDLSLEKEELAQRCARLERGQAVREQVDGLGCGRAGAGQRVFWTVPRLPKPQWPTHLRSDPDPVLLVWGLEGAGPGLKASRGVLPPVRWPGRCTRGHRESDHRHRPAIAGTACMMLCTTPTVVGTAPDMLDNHLGPGYAPLRHSETGASIPLVHRKH